MCITTTCDVTRLEMYLRNAFANVLSHRKWKYVASDCVNTLSAMAYMMLHLPTCKGTHFTRVCKIQITRLVIYRKLFNGQSTAYVENFAVAADGEGVPTWLREAEQRAACATRAALARPATDHSSFRGRGGPFRGRGGQRGRAQGARESPTSGN